MRDLDDGSKYLVVIQNKFFSFFIGLFLLPLVPFIVLYYLGLKISPSKNFIAVFAFGLFFCPFIPIWEIINLGEKVLSYEKK